MRGKSTCWGEPNLVLKQKYLGMSVCGPGMSPTRLKRWSERVDQHGHFEGRQNWATDAPLGRRLCYFQSSGWRGLRVRLMVLLGLCRETKWLKSVMQIRGWCTRPKHTRVFLSESLRAVTGRFSSCSSSDLIFMWSYFCLHWPELKGSLGSGTKWMRIKAHVQRSSSLLITWIDLCAN